MTPEPDSLQYIKDENRDPRPPLIDFSTRGQCYVSATPAAAVDLRLV